MTLTDTFWWHSFNINGQVTPGRKSEQLLEAEWAAMQLPDLTGKTVLDIGCWDGWFSFKAEREGAAKVVAMDHYVWSIDLSRWKAEGGDYERHSFYDRPEFYDPANLPGKQGFDIAHAALGSNVEARVDFKTAEIEPFDIVIFSGVLYHLTDPFGGLRKLREIARELAVVESECQEFGDSNRALWWFIRDSQLAYDASNWWVPNERGLIDACHAAGFACVVPQGRVEPHRLIVHAS